MAFCSAVTLCFAAICAVVSAALLSIAFATDNWQVIKVDRDQIEVSCKEGKLSGSILVLSIMYYTRPSLATSTLYGQKVATVLLGSDDGISQLYVCTTGRRGGV